MADWKDFERNATKLLNDIFNDFNLSFESGGGTNSKDSDIKIKKDNNFIANIEAKYNEPQCGQITVVPEANKFIYSEKSVNNINQYTNVIIKYLNDNFHRYKNYSTKSINVDIDESILANWVKTYYSEESEWLIYSKNKDTLTESNVLLIPINDLDKYFTVSAKFRIKKSGSNSKIADKDKERVKNIINDYLKDKVFTIEEDSKKLFVITDEEIGKTKLDDGYYISAKNSSGKFGITKRNQTKNPNPNVMFDLTLKENVEFKGKLFKDTYLQ